MPQGSLVARMKKFTLRDDAMRGFGGTAAGDGVGEPGTTEAIAATLWRDGSLLFSNNWDGAVTREQLLKGGNLQVR